MQSHTPWKTWTFIGVLALSPFVADRSQASGPGNADDYVGTFYAALADRAEILHIHADGTAGITLSDQVTAGAGGFTFSDSMGSWRVTGNRRLSARFLNLNFDVTGQAPTYSGMAVVDYDLQFAPNLRSFAASCAGKIYPSGQDPFAPGAVPVTEFDCAYLNGNPYRRMPLP